MADQNEGKGFTVVDRRGRESEEEPPEAPASPGPGAESQAGAEEKDEKREPERPLPEIDFATFVLSLSTSALFHLGLIEDPETGKRMPPNMALARQTVDTLEMLQEKTRGNLAKEEAELLQNLLTELRMRCVEVARG